MAKLTLYLDQRKADKNGYFPIKFHISNGTTTTTISTGITTIPKYFKGEPTQVVMRTAPCAGQTNAAVYELYCRYLDAILELERENRINGMTAADIRRYANGEEKRNSDFSFTEYFDICIDECNTEKTRKTFLFARQAIERYHSTPLQFTDITDDFLTRFERWMSAEKDTDGSPKRKIGIASRGIVFRNIRIVFNKAIKRHIIGRELYPFDTFKIKSSNKDKEFLPLNGMQRLLALDLSKEQGCEGLSKARDFFLLSFLFCGINPIDLFNLPQQNGQISFVRRKIAHHEPSPIHIAIQPETQNIIDRHKGKKYLLSFAEEYANFDSFYYFMRHRLELENPIYFDPRNQKLIDP